MSEPGGELLASWRARAAGQVLVFTGERDADAQENMLVFSLKDVQSGGVSTDALADFLIQSAGRVPPGRASTKELSLWFYAWVDEMSGTLRTSWTATADGALPFACALRISDSPDEVCALALASGYADGIPFEELEEEGADFAPEEKFVLPVFARRAQAR